MTKRLYCFLILLFSFITIICKAQLYEVSLDEKVNNSTLIIEGKVVAQKSFWNSGHTMIFTANKIEIYKTFKGEAVSSSIEVMTQGGSVGGDAIEASDLLSLDVGYVGVYFCFPNALQLKSPETNDILFDTYASSQGFLQYNLSGDKAFAPFVEYSGIEKHLYPLLISKTGSKVRIINSSFKVAAFQKTVKKKGVGTKPGATAIINTFSPAIITAGALNDPANNVLTINGTGFGTPAAGIQLVFKDANNTNTTADYVLESTSPYITSWSDNTIVLRTPQRAATGTFGVVKAIGDTAFSPSPLTAFYSILNASFFSGTLVHEPRLMNASTLGGYSIDYSTNTSGSGTNILTDSAYDCFRRALTTWKDLTGVNFLEAGTTANQVVSGGDGLNSIMFDNANTGLSPLPAGTLAVTYSGYSICTGAQMAQKTGFDLVIRKDGFSSGTTFPANNTYCGLRINTNDLEAVLLHELGHALNLGHVYGLAEQTSNYTTRNPGLVMNPTITLSISRKSPDQSALAGGLYNVTPQGFTNYGTCHATTEMAPLATNVSPYNECPSTFPAMPIAPGYLVNIDLEHCTSNRYKDPQFKAISTANSTNGVGVPVTNNAYYAVKTGGTGELTMNIINYHTMPAGAETDCAEQGVRIAVYKVNACPQGQAFPAPVYTTTFSGNTAKTISGLSDNETYLIYFDGLYSTKANFNIVFSGTALPIELSDFRGRVNKTVNDFFIEMKSASGHMKMMIERSGDGTLFKEIGEVKIETTSAPESYTYTDQVPFNGNNYYRLKLIERDGSFNYSKIILLKNNLAGKMSIYPNPANDIVNVNLSFLPQNTYTIIITDIAGRKLYTRQVTQSVEKFSLGNHAPGTYIIQVNDNKNSLFAIEKIQVQQRN